MAIERSASSPKKGMNRDTHPSELQSSEYSFALNANIHDEHGSGQVVIQNEPSNIKCTGFKSGYKVVGQRFDTKFGEVFYFLTNPTTGDSEIGVVRGIGSAEPLLPTEVLIGSNLQVVLETPLESTTQIPTCQYETLLSDVCESETRCLNFSVDSPIHDNNIHIKYGKTGRTLWWTDGERNPQRYIQVDNLDIYTNTVNNCDDETTEVCLDCEKMRVFPLFKIPCLFPEVIQNGGNLPAGLIEVIICYSNINGDTLSNFYSLTNPIPIQDPNNNILDQTNLNYLTNQAVKISVSGLDTSYEFYKIVALYRSGLDGAQSVYNIGVFPISQDNFKIVTFNNKASDLSLEDIISRKPYYSRAKNLAVANGYLYHSGLTSEREINLQPIVNLLGGFARWNTYQAKEELYVDGIGVSNYKSTLRDEVYPYGITFDLSGGQETALFPFIARPPLDAEVETVVESADTLSVLEYNKQCQEDDRTKVWQFYNTAQELGDCLVPGEGPEGLEVEREVQATCFIEDEDGNLVVVDTIENSTLEVPGNQDIVSYINSNITSIIASTGPNGEDIREILDDPSEYPETCTPEFGVDCSEDIVLVSEEIFAISVGSQSFAIEYQDSDEYEPSLPNNNCAIWVTDETGVVRDTVFETAYMDAAEEVFKRLSVTNTSCAASITAPTLTSPQSPNFNHFLPLGELTTISTLQQPSINVTLTKFSGAIRLTGTSGTANVDVNGTNYLATFSTNLTITAANFVTAHAASILTDTGLILTSIGDTLILNGLYDGFFTTAAVNVSGDLSGVYDNESFTQKLHSNALWYKVDFGGSDRIIFELGTSTCSNTDDNTSESVRISAFAGCSDTIDVPTYGVIINDISVNNPSKIITLNSADFFGNTGSVYIAIDTPIRSREVAGKGQVNTLVTPCGCFPVYRRDAEFINVITYSDLTFGKKQTYSTMCTFVIPQLNSCTAVPYKRGLFGYVESAEKYPCVKELYDSSELTIGESDIPVDFKTEFEQYYVDSVVSGTYVLKPETDFRDKPIRHYRFPDNNVAPFMSYAKTGEPSQNPGPFGKAIIYPMGFSISPEVINAFLDIAVKNQLLTIEERARITGYKIFRGSRTTERSIIAKGILFDTYKYQDAVDTTTEDVLYTNYPLNSLGDDRFNGTSHPFNSLRNNAYTFHSPETSFYKPSLANELRVEGYVYGHAANYFDEVRSHPTYVMLGSGAYALATTIAIAECTFELLLQSTTWLIDGASGTFGSGGVSNAVAIAGVTALALQSFLRAGEYRYRWIRTFTDLGKPTNFAYYQAAIGYYNLFVPNTTSAQILRGLRTRTYVKEGRWEISDEIGGTTYNFNNLDGEDSVFMHLGAYSLNYPSLYINYDNVNVNSATASRRGYSGIGRSPKIQSNAASPYVSMKNYLPSQYGTIDSITWLDTGFCGSLESVSECDAAFGGDIFISRFSLKRKLPFFRANSMGLAPLTPFKYSDYFNINPNSITNRFYIDYEINEDTDFVGTFIYPSNKSRYNLDSGGSSIGGFYIKQPNKFYLFSYGIPHFLVESEINCNYRYAGREAHENFYPNINDVIEFTQEENVSIRKKNEYFYNSVYSTAKSLYPYRLLPQDYNRELYDRLTNQENSVIYSEQDVSENSVFDKWLQYKPLNEYTFSRTNGTLVTISGIESQQLLARFTSGFTIFGAIDQMRDRLTPETENLGNGGIFAGRPIDFNITELGYAGTQHNAKISNEFGHFWVDAERGKVFHLGPNAQGLKEISRSSDGVNNGMEKWFKENLPLKLPKQIPGLGIDNAHNRVGITMGWDDRLKRVFITKKDYVAIQPINYLKDFGFFIGSGETVQKIELTNTEYFRECSWTIAYNPLLGTWISYYSFRPNYYISFNEYFQTGVNVGRLSQIGVWSHYSYQSSYQVFYGDLYPFTIEYPTTTKGSNSVLNFIEYWLDVRKYYNKYDSADAYGIGFNKAVVYNPFQNSGLLELEHQKDNDLYQHLDYPRHNVNSVTILQTEINHKWSFNFLYNRIRNERSGLPVWLYDCPQVDKTLDDRLLDYTYQYRDYLRGDYFLVRLTNDKESRFKFLFRFATDERNFYAQ